MHAHCRPPARIMPLTQPSLSPLALAIGKTGRYFFVCRLRRVIGETPMGQMPNHDRKSRRAVLAGIASAIALPFGRVRPAIPCAAGQAHGGICSRRSDHIAMRALAEHRGRLPGPPGAGGGANRRGRHSSRAIAPDGSRRWLHDRASGSALPSALHGQARLGSLHRHQPHHPFGGLCPWPVHSDCGADPELGGPGASSKERTRDSWHMAVLVPSPDLTSRWR